MRRARLVWPVPFYAQPSMMCGSCQTESPGDSAFCPQCGAKLATAAEQTEALPTALSAPPLPAAPRQTEALPAPPLPAAGRQTEAARRSGYSAHGREPRQPTRLPFERNVPRLVAAGALVVIALWLSLWFLPRHAPLSADAQAQLAESAGAGAVARARAAKLSEEVHLGGWVSVVALFASGLALAATGYWHRSHRPVMCRGCHRPVVAWKGPLALYCTRESHMAQLRWPLVVVTGGFWAAAVIGGAVALLVLA